MTVPGNRSNAKALRPKRCVVLDGGPCAACAEDIKLEQEMENVVEELHNRRRALRTVMNENHDLLIQRFPPEIISHVFIQYAPAIASAIASRDKRNRSTPLRLGSVCRKWRQLAWTTPQLWSCIVIGPRKVRLELIAEWLERSGGLPLTIRFYDPRGQHEGVSSILNQYSARWYDVYLDIPPTYLPRFDGSSQTDILHRLVLCNSTSPVAHSDLSKFRMKSEPRPTNLTLLGVCLPWVDITWNNLTVASVSGIDVGDCVELIRRAPLLQTLRMLEIKSLSSIFPLPDTRIVHAHLRSLKLLQIEHESPSVHFLNSVCFPSLEQWLHEHEILLVEHMISFVEWSPRLKVLKIGIDHVPAHHVTQLCGHLSALENLEMRGELGAGYHQIIDMLCTSGESPRFLPRLQSLDFLCEDAESFPWDSLPQIFASSRWRSLRVNVNVPPGWSDIVDHTAKLLRELIDKGFDLRIVGDGEAETLQLRDWYW